MQRRILIVDDVPINMVHTKIILTKIVEKK
jgi:hypothetical protein